MSILMSKRTILVFFNGISFEIPFFILYFCDMCEKLIIPSKTERLMQKSPFLFTRGHDFVEIGGIKWATCNVGGEKPTDTGLYFQWGNVKPCYIKGSIMYENVKKRNVTDMKDIIEISDDAVHAAWGGTWRLPTISEWRTLVNSVVPEWTTDYQGSGVVGLVCTDKTDSSKVLFFPAAGYCMCVSETGYLNKIYCKDTVIYCWSNTAFVDGDGCSYAASFINNGKIYLDNAYIRTVGFTVRGVLNS